MHVKSRLGNAEMHPLPKGAAAEIKQAARLMRQDRGINIFCDVRIPEHFHHSSISQRSDACLNEPDNYNGFGVWWLIPQPNDKPIVLAAFDRWTSQEEKLLGKNIAAAEGLGIVLGARLVQSSIVNLDSFENMIQLSDSETAFIKFNNVRLGSILLESLRIEWQSLISSWPIPTHLGYIPREWNVGSDLLSKGHWSLFCEVMRLAGLGEPRRIIFSDLLRSSSNLF